jgi:hypothetical protein
MFPGLRLLLRDGHKVELDPRAFDVLWMLFGAGGELVSKYEIIEMRCRGRYPRPRRISPCNGEPPYRRAVPTTPADRVGALVD